MRLALSLMVCCFLVISSTLLRDDFHLQVTIVTGEHSRDSNSTSRILTVAAGELIYEESYHGAFSGRRQPIKKRFKLTRQDEADLIALLKSKKLLTTATVSQPATEEGFSHYFETSVVATLDGKETTMAIGASRSATQLKTDPRYLGTVDLIQRLYQIINRSTEKLTAPTLIDSD